MTEFADVHNSRFVLSWHPKAELMQVIYVRYRNTVPARAEFNERGQAHAPRENTRAAVRCGNHARVNDGDIGQAQMLASP